MSENKKEIKWWPHYVLRLALLMLVATALIVLLAYLFPVPDDAPMEIPLPDHGANVPGPEWVFTILWMPFWYLKGRMKKYLFIMPLIPIAIMIYLVLLPYMHKLPLDRIPGLKGLMEKARAMRSGFKKSFVYAVPALVCFFVLMVGVVRSGHQAKILGCDSCHNPAMGHRMAIPPMDVFNYYMVDRARQIGVGKYRAGKSGGLDNSGNMIYESKNEEAGGYKDANWQMRHMYEPTFTW